MTTLSRMLGENNYPQSFFASGRCGISRYCFFRIIFFYLELKVFRLKCRKKNSYNYPKIINLKLLLS